MNIRKIFFGTPPRTGATFFGITLTAAIIAEIQEGIRTGDWTKLSCTLNQLMLIDKALGFTDCTWKALFSAGGVTLLTSGIVGVTAGLFKKGCTKSAVSETEAAILNSSNAIQSSVTENTSLLNVSA